MDCINHKCGLRVNFRFWVALLDSCETYGRRSFPFVFLDFETSSPNTAHSLSSTPKYR